MKWPKLIFVISLAIIFIGTTFISIIGVSQVLNQVFRTYVLKYEICNYKARSLSPEELIEPVSDKDMTEECYIDYNSAKRGISSGLSMFLIAFPIALISKRGLKKAVKVV